MIYFRHGPPAIAILLLVILAAFLPAASAASGTATCSPLPCTGTSPGSLSLPADGPVSAEYVPPPGTMPVIVLAGNPYEMGYQYGLEAPEYIATARDAAWASALSENSYALVLDNCTIAKTYIESELTGFDFLSFFRGMSDAMNAQGIPFTPTDPVVMLSYGGRQGPAAEHCTEFAVTGNVTGGNVIAGTNFDYYILPSNTYTVLLALYPDDGYSCVLPAGAGRTGSSAVANEAGLVYLLASSPSQGEGDTGPGINGFLELPYVGMTAGSVEEAEQELLAITKAFPLNRLLADSAGNAEVIEATRVRHAIRSPDASGYLIATNYYLDPAMKPSQKTWDPLAYYPSAYYRYVTAEKGIVDHAGAFTFATAKEILSSTSWWDGTRWHENDPWSTNTVNRFRPDVATLYSFIAMPGENVVSVCTGNPGMPVYGTRAPGQTGTYVNISVAKTPGEMVYQIRADANTAFWDTAQVIGTVPSPETAELYADAEYRYWEAVWWHDRAVLETDRNRQAVAYGKAATGFAGSIADLAGVRSLAGNADPVQDMQKAG